LIARSRALATEKPLQEAHHERFCHT
jgi:hypothetical protein